MTLHTVTFFIYTCIFVATIVFTTPANEKNDTATAMLYNSTVIPLSEKKKDWSLIQNQGNNGVNDTEDSKKMFFTPSSITESNREQEMTGSVNVTTEIIPPQKQENIKNVVHIDSVSKQPALVEKSSTNKMNQISDSDDFFNDDNENMKLDSESGKKDLEFETVKKIESDSSSAHQSSYPIPNSKMDNDKSSHFFAYFLTLMVATIFLYLLFHNKKRIFALVLEGRSEQTRRRSNRARYHKLDNNLEEAMSNTKGSNSSLNQVY